MATNPTLLTQPIAANGAKNVIPNTTSTAGAMSQDQGFPAETSLPLGAGGVAPTREDFNGAFNLLGGIAFYAQKGWTFEYDATQDYYKGCVVIDATDGKRYECIADVSAGGSVPSADTTHWKEFGTDTTVLANTDLSNLTATGLNAFATKTLSNLNTSNLTYHLVIDSYYDDTTGDWYRVYDDGWVEQGGHLPVPTGKETPVWSVDTQVTLLKPMVDSNYTVILGDYEPDNSNYAYGYTLQTKTTTGFTFRDFNEGIHSGTLYPFDYLIFGMGVQS